MFCSIFVLLSFYCRNCGLCDFCDELIVDCDSGKRPFGVSILYIGWDKHHGFQLYQSDPSGNYGGWKATCIGNNSAVSFTSFTVLHLTDNFTVKTSHDRNLFDLAWIWNSTHILYFKTSLFFPELLQAWPGPQKVTFGAFSVDWMPFCHSADV